MRSRVIPTVAVILVFVFPFYLESNYGPSEGLYPPSPSTTRFAGKVLVFVPPPISYDLPGSDPNVSIERVNYIGADGIMMSFER